MNTKNSLILLFICFSMSLFGQKVTTLISDTSKRFESIHWHESGRILCVDFNNGRLYEIKTNGDVETLATGIANPAGGGFDTDGTFYFSELAKGKIHRLNDDNTYTEISSGFNQPTGILPIPDSDILLVGEYGSNAVTKVNKITGEKTSWVSQNGLNGPDAVIAFEDDFLIANFNNARINRVDIDGNISNFWNLGHASFLGYLAYTGDKVFTPIISIRKIYSIDQDGNSEWIAGSGEMGFADGDALSATFSNPNGITANPAGDTILITDSHTIRILTDFQETVSVDDFESIKVNISPNPASNELIIRSTDSSGANLEYRIFDMNGKLMKEGEIYDSSNIDHKVDVLDFKSGTYILVLSDDKGNSAKKEFIKI